MGKRADHDSTMEVSTSQLVPDALPRGRGPRPPMSPNDVSVWKQVVDGAADFAPPPKARPGRGRRWLIAGALGLGVAAGGAYAMHWLSSKPGGSPAAPGGAADPAGTAALPSAAPAAAPAPPPAQTLHRRPHLVRRQPQHCRRSR
jgi:hypothetical protein